MNTSGLDSKVTIHTPEQVALEYELAGLGSRILAFLFDSLIRFLINLVILIIGGVVLFILFKSYDLFHLFKETVEEYPQFPLWCLGIGGFIYFFVNYGYYIFFETIWNGQSPGKKLLGLRVIRDGGYPIGLFESVVRNLFRIVDTIPGNYLVGALSVFLSRQEKRIGDFVAGTIVVRERDENIPERIYSDSSTKQHVFTDDQFSQDLRLRLHRLSQEEYLMITEFLERREEFVPSHRVRMSTTLVQTIQQKLDITKPETVSSEDFLARLADLYRSEQKFIS